MNQTGTFSLYTHLTLSYCLSQETDFQEEARHYQAQLEGVGLGQSVVTIQAWAGNMVPEGMGGTLELFSWFQLPHHSAVSVNFGILYCSSPKGSHPVRGRHDQLLLWKIKFGDYQHGRVKKLYICLCPERALQSSRFRSDKNWPRTNSLFLHQFPRGREMLQK